MGEKEYRIQTQQLHAEEWGIPLKYVILHILKELF